MATLNAVGKFSESGGGSSFFRQTGWLMLANVIGGILMWAVHPLAKLIPKTEYSVFGVLLAVAMCIPTMPLQIVLAQQAADALATGKERQLSGKIRIVTMATLLLWAVFAVVVFVLQDKILRAWKIQNPAGLWITVVVVLFGMWLPIFWGLLQGTQKFLTLGWSMMNNGIFRFLASLVGVAVLGWQSAGMIAGVLMGMTVALGIAVWDSRSILFLKPEPF